MPRTETTTRTLYRFEELTEDAQARAIESYRDARIQWLGTEWDEEWIDSRARVAKMLDARWGGWYGRPGGPCIGSCFDPTEDAPYGAEPEPLRGVRLWKWIHNAVEWPAQIGDAGSCPFTGFGSDESYLDPLRAFLARPSASVDLDELVSNCIAAGDRAWENEREWGASDECIRERLMDGLDEVEFLEDGTEA